MIFFRVVAFAIFIGVTAVAGDQPITVFQRTALLRDWKTVRFGMYDQSDYRTRRNTILLQRLDSKQAALSVIRESSAADWPLPVLVTVVPEAHASKLVEQALNFCIAAQTEEPASDKIENQTRWFIMFLEFVTAFGPSEDKEYNYRVNFDLGLETHIRFSKLIEDAAKAPKN